MNNRINTPWHRESWKEFLYEKIPLFLNERVNLSQYHIKHRGPDKVSMTLETENGPVLFESLPYPDERGLFTMENKYVTVVPELGDNLVRAACCGDLALSYIKERTGTPSESMGNDPDSFRLWFPLDRLLEGFFKEYGQILDSTNWLSIETHLNRVRISDRAVTHDESFLGRLDPVECPEGPNMGRVYTVAWGASIDKGVLMPNKGAGFDDLGPAARRIPFIEFSDSARVLMGANMMRQWLVPENGEMPLVQTGLEMAGEIPLGFNLLTAFTTVGVDTCEDGLVLSRSAVERMGYADPVTPGDKFSNRHGQKGIISAIYEDQDMPKLPDGRTVELICSFLGLHSRLNFGMILETVAGLKADFSGKPVVAAPFEGAKPEKLVSSGMPDYCDDQGMVKLQFPHGKGDFTTTAGYVYWGRTKHTGISKLIPESHQRVGIMEYSALIDSGAVETAAVLASVQSEDPQKLNSLVKILKEADISLSRTDRGIKAGFIQPRKGDLAYCDHPWADARGLYALPQEERIRDLAARLSPEKEIFPALRENLERNLKMALEEYFRENLTSSLVNPGNRVRNSARALLAPGSMERQPDEIGIPAALTDLFYPEGPESMKDSFLLFNRAPTFRPSSMLALRPYAAESPCLRIHPLLCFWINGDFDGDQAALIKPEGERALKEIKETLTLSAHLRRDPTLISSLLPRQEALLGLYYLIQAEEGLNRVEQILNMPLPGGATLKIRLTAALTHIMEKRGTEALISSVHQLFVLGMDRISSRGYSISPLLGEGTATMEPQGVGEIIEGGTEEEVRSFSIQRDAVISGARGTIKSLAQLVGQIGYADIPGREHKDSFVNTSRSQGLSREDYHAMAAGMRRGFLTNFNELYEEKYIRGYDIRMDFKPKGRSFLARAMRSDNPGLVFTHAAQNKELDPLTDPWAAVFCGQVPR